MEFNCSQGYPAGQPPEFFNAALRSGLVAPSEASPLWGGMAVTALLPPAGLPSSLGAVLALATGDAKITGFTTFYGASAMLRYETDASVPLARAGEGSNPGGAINWYSLGSRIQLWVQVAKDHGTQLGTGKVNQPVYWDYTNQALLAAPASPSDSPIPVTLLAVNMNGDAQVVAPGGAFWVDTGYAALILL